MPNSVLHHTCVCPCYLLSLYVQLNNIYYLYMQMYIVISILICIHVLCVCICKCYESGSHSYYLKCGRCEFEKEEIL